MTTGPNLGLIDYTTQGAAWFTAAKALLRGLDGLVMPSVKDKDLTAPPGGESNGDRYIVGAGATGAWSGHAKDIARYQTSDAEGGAGWDFFTPKEGWQLWVDDEDVFYRYSGSAWASVPASGSGAGVYATKTANYTLSAVTDYTIGADVSGGTFTLTLPAASSNSGAVFRLLKTDSSTTIVTIGRTGADTFEGWAGSQTSLHLRLQWQDVTLQSDGSSKWIVLGRYVPHVSCLATASSTTTSTSGAETAIAFNTESWDTHTMHDNASNNTRVTVPCSGRYRIRGRNRFATGGTGDAAVFVRKNGTASAWYAFDQLPQNANGVPNECVGMVDLVAGDYLELTQSRTDGATRANQVLANLYPEFEVTLLEPLV